MLDKTLREFFQSKIFTAVIIGIGSLIILLIVFRLGIAVGYHRALFATGWGEHYKENFIGPRALPPGFDGKLINAHGASGDILSVSGNTISMSDSDGVEKSVLVGSSTLIMQYKDRITPDKLATGEHIVVIGAPNSSGQIAAKLIRVLPAPGKEAPAATASTTADYFFYSFK